VEVLKIIPGVVLLPLSVYLGWKKLRHSVSVAFTVGSDFTTARRIQRVFLANNKDRPVTIFSIQAVINKELTYEIQKFDTPHVIKAMETVSIETAPYSKLMIGGSEWEPNLIDEDKIDIYLEVPTGVIKCKELPHPSLSALSQFRHLTRASKITSAFNGIVYNDNARYAITYATKGSTTRRTALVDVGGFVRGDWDFRINKMTAQQLTSIEGVWEFLKLSNADQLFTIYGVDALE
jgi:hypothetical protein